MKMPGFNADKSIYVNNSCYKVRGSRSASINLNAVTPQAKIKWSMTSQNCGTCFFEGFGGFFIRTGKKWCYNRTCDYVIDTETFVSSTTCTDSSLYTVSCGFFGQQIV